MAEEISCVYCGHPNPADAMFCQACSRVLEDPAALKDQTRITYLAQEGVLVTEDSAFLYGQTYPISQIKEVEVIELTKDRSPWGVGLIVFGVGSIIDGLIDGELFSLACGLPLILLGALLVKFSQPTPEKKVSTLWITTADGEEHSRQFADPAEAREIKEAIQRSCADQGNQLENEDS